MNEETRVSLWEAFSDFFLDTEISDIHFIHAARVVKKSGISPAEAEAILWNEVFPVLYPNLLSVAGEWAGWSREWLKANLTGVDVTPLMAAQRGSKAIEMDETLFSLGGTPGFRFDPVHIL